MWVKNKDMEYFGNDELDETDIESFTTWKKHRLLQAYNK